MNPLLQQDIEKLYITPPICKSSNTSLKKILKNPRDGSNYIQLEYNNPQTTDKLANMPYKSPCDLLTGKCIRRLDVLISK